ncbi:hypothetical protein QFC21_002750 [Naganishia friedmannii]|uniref:Uncharacterized protein n=1 Tax=Naganishia friedmannii TaxID=89922 RepID=A0ACC2VTD6_9TREE|nr:hypothetical protein QFC21_002750 [Naganishia friedmannii]
MEGIVDAILNSTIDMERQRLESELDASLGSFRPPSAHHPKSQRMTSQRHYGERIDRHGRYVDHLDSAEESDASSAFSSISHVTRSDRGAGGMATLGLHHNDNQRYHSRHHEATFTTSTSDEDEDDDTIEYPRSAAVHNMRHLDDFGRYDTQRSPTPVNVSNRTGSGSGMRNLLSNRNAGNVDPKKHSDSFDRGGMDSFTGFASPGSTAQHHVSRMTLGAGGIFENNKSRKSSRTKPRSHDKENSPLPSDEEEEFDPDRPISKLVQELERGDWNRDVQSTKDAKRTQPSTGRINSFATQPKASNIFSDANGTSPQQPARQQSSAYDSHLQPIPHYSQPQQFRHKPVQPSPLRSLVVPSPDSTGSRDKSKSSQPAASLGNKAHAAQSSTSRQRQYQPPRVEDEEEELFARQKQRSTSPKGPPPSAPVINVAESSERNREATHNNLPRTRVVSNPETQSSKPAMTRDRPTAYGTENLLADMTRLTTMLGTPAKGNIHEAVADDGVVSENSNRINENLQAIYARLHSLENETTMSRRRIRELEMDLENSRIDSARSRKDKQEVEQRYTVLENEKKELERLVVVLRREVAKVTQDWQAEMVHTKELQARLEGFQQSPSHRARRGAHGSNTRGAADSPPDGLDTMMDGLMRRIEQLEREVGRLRSVVQRAVELKDATFDGERTMMQGDQEKNTRKASAKPSQYQEGLVAAAYNGSDNREPFGQAFGRSEHVLIDKPLTPPPSDEDHGQISPSANRNFVKTSTNMESHPDRAAGRRQRRRSRRDIHDSRSDEPQEDPATSPFPSIRGERLEQEFFSPSQKPRVGRPSSGNALRFGDTARVPVEKHKHADHEDRGYGTEEKAKGAAPAALHIDELDQVLRRNDGEMPPQTLVMSVLREIEDDYKHYLSIYTDLAEQYKRMSPLSMKRNILAEHLKEVIDTMELKANQVARLTEVLQVKDKAFTAPVIKAAQASRARMSVPETVRAVRQDLGKSFVSTPLPKRRQEHAVV